MYTLIAVLALFVSASQAQDALATYGYNYVTQFFTMTEIAKVAIHRNLELRTAFQIESAVASQICNGATVQQIFDNFINTVSQNIGGTTAVRAVSVVSKLQNDLGNDFQPVKDAVSAAAQNVFTPVLTDIGQYCGSGHSYVIQAAGNYANTQFMQGFFDQIGQYCGSGLNYVTQAAGNYANSQFMQGFFDQVYQAINGVSPNDWATCRNDLTNNVFFQNYGY
uniref:DUF148 domain-containing protein n=1 Tax=Steinernema glaseri TaxID=37863 RepID=A0A1I7ZBQ2_9BILA